MLCSSATDLVEFYWKKNKFSPNVFGQWSWTNLATMVPWGLLFKGSETLPATVPFISSQRLISKPDGFDFLSLMMNFAILLVDCSLTTGFNFRAQNIRGTFEKQAPNVHDESVMPSALITLSKCRYLLCFLICEIKTPSFVHKPHVSCLILV